MVLTLVSNTLRFAKRSFVISRYKTIMLYSTGNDGTTGIGKREKAYEDQYIRSHDREKLRELREKLLQADETLKSIKDQMKTLEDNGGKDK